MFRNEVRKHKSSDTRTFGWRNALLVGVALLLAFAGTAPAGVETATWKGGNMADWNTPSNWNPEVVPKNSLTTQYEVVINDATTNPEGPFISNLNVIINTLTVSETDSFVEIRDGGTLKINNSAGLDNNGTITVMAGGKLTLNGGTSKSKLIKLVGIEGTAKRAKLRIDSDTTLDEPSLGAGCKILGEDGTDDTSGAGCIGCPGPTPETPDGLIEGAVNATLTITANGTIHGELEINAGLTNNGLVDADDPAGKIFLTGANKSGGDGAEWKATKGLLDVDTDVTGSADWTIQESGFLLVDGGNISGTDFDFLKVNGTNPWLFVINQTVTIAGNLDITMEADHPEEDCNAPSEGSANKQWKWYGQNPICKFTGGVDPDPYVTVEVSARDHGLICNDWDVGFAFQCMAMGTKVVIAAGARVKLVDNWDNNNSIDDPGHEVQHCELENFRVTVLSFEDTAGRLDLNDFDAHFHEIDGDEGTQIVGIPACACP